MHEESFDDLCEDPDCNASVYYDGLCKEHALEYGEYQRLDREGARV